METEAIKAQLRRIRIWYRVINALVFSFFGVKSRILTARETEETIIKGKSLVRFGDGEFGIYVGKDIHYQPYSLALGREFDSIKATYEKMGDQCPFLLAVPKKYMQCSGFELCKKRVLVSSWSEPRLRFKKTFDLSKTYGDAFLFQKENTAIYGKIWDNSLNQREIIFIHNNVIYAKQFEDRYKRHVHFIKCMSYDAYSKIGELQASVENKICELNGRADNIQLVISAGPAGKVLAYRLSMRGYQCIDVGHCWDEPLES